MGPTYRKITKRRHLEPEPIYLNASYEKGPGDDFSVLVKPCGPERDEEDRAIPKGFILSIPESELHAWIKQIAEFRAREQLRKERGW
jgi:hypothetical protein